MAVDVAVDRFWLEVALHYSGTYKKTVWAALRWLVKELGATTLIRDIGPNKITEAVARRRGDGVKNATVNRTVTELLRAILRRAERRWEQTVQRIEWRDMMLPEARERVRELRDHEEDTLFARIRPDYVPIIRFALVTGLRKRELVGLRWSDIDWTARTVTVRGKGNKIASIPLTTEMQAILAPLRGHHPEVVFTYVSQRPRRNPRDGRTRVRGTRYPITLNGLNTAWQRHGAAAAGIEDFRLHDLRHTAATRLLRASGNLRIVQKLLRHEHITTTVRYAHADDSDLRNAMEAAAGKVRPARTEDTG